MSHSTFFKLRSFEAGPQNILVHGLHDAEACPSDYGRSLLKGVRTFLSYILAVAPSAAWVLNLIEISQKLVVYKA